MISINNNFCTLPETYLFSKIAKKIEEYKEQHPQSDIIKMGIGDVTKPICKASIDAMHKAVDEMGSSETFRGYGPEQGYDFLRNKISTFDYKNRNIEISPNEIFISDGAKSDTGNIGDIFSKDNKIAVTDPVYPVYVDTNVMAGRAGNFTEDGMWDNIEYLPCTEENDFIPKLPTLKPSIIYLCYPNNPTGTTLTRTELKKWVAYALENKAIILFDSAYEAFIKDKDVPHSIYEIEGAKKCALEFRSFSKTAGFTGLRCGYTVIPKELVGYDKDGNGVSLNKLWNRRQTTKFNGASYITQRAAEAIYSEDGQKQIQESIDFYLDNASILRKGLSEAGLKVFGGVNAPYVWVKTPGKLSSWEFFDELLDKCNIVGTPGVGFGKAGEGYFRFTAFSNRENTIEAVKRIKEYMAK